MEARKNTLAAEKMDYLAAGGNPAGRGKGRGVHLWVILVVLSLVVCHMSGLPSPKGQMGQERQCLKEAQREPALSQNVTFRVHFDCPGIRRMGLCNHNRSWFKICRLKEGTIYIDPVAISRNESSIKASREKKAWKNRDISRMPINPICDKCNKTVWVRGKKESTFVVYFQVNKLCYDQNKLGMCMMNGKTYWVGNNVKLNTASLNSGPIILDLLNENDERVCLKLEGTFCFFKNEEGMDPENKIQKVAQELKRRESEAKRKRMEQERIRTLSEQYKQLEKQYSDWGLPASSKNLFTELMQEIATELGLSNCWICEGLKSAEEMALERLIHSVVQGVQIAAMPTDPECARGKTNQGMQIAALPTDRELAVEKTGQIPEVSRIMKLEGREEANKVAEALEKFEEKIKEENVVYQKYCEISQEEWNDYSKFEDD
ncbi:hypothetical protein DUI87_11106 [Hirundo rustica rustica]|uniref:Uncharacterized protein n=1 Tax=Hirundo rustica rustica TaxID=333673 RepID=A0A3M0KFI8_HIRRU|nr:hypothetical protein DUI87_11106 [Hirundo rustica rustica]